MRACGYVYIHVHICMNVYIFTYMCTYQFRGAPGEMCVDALMWICVCTCVYVYKYVHIYTQIYVIANSEPHQWRCVWICVY